MQNKGKKATEQKARKTSRQTRRNAETYEICGEMGRKSGKQKLWGDEAVIAAKKKTGNKMGRMANDLQANKSNCFRCKSQTKA